MLANSFRPAHCRRMDANGAETTAAVGYNRAIDPAGCAVIIDGAARSGKLQADMLAAPISNQRTGRNSGNGGAGRKGH